MPNPTAEKLLIVDDSDLSRGAFKLSLEREGYAVEAAANGEEALKLIEAQKFDIVLLDIQMPGIDGYEVLNRIRKKYISTELPVIMVTGRDGSADVVRALESGANDYVAKPINFPVALARIRTQLLHKRSVEILKENEARLRELDDMKNDFISMVNHELTAPIAVIDGAIHSFKDKLFGPFNEKYESYVGMIAQKVSHLSRLANDLMDITKLGAGRFSIEPHPADLRQIVQTACRALQEQTKNSPIRIEFQDTTSEIPVQADPQRMEQVVFNILRNALRFAKSKVEVGLEKSGEECRLVIQDDGPGIDPNDLPKVFDKFYQGKNGRRTGGGSGLGLAIVKGIVESHGGRVSVENRDGARFSVTLPIS